MITDNSWIGDTCRNGHTRTEDNTTVTWNASLGHYYLRCDECRRANQVNNYTKKRKTRLDEVIDLLEECAATRASAAKVLEISGYSRMDKFYAAMRRRGHHELAERIKKAVKPLPKPKAKPAPRYRPYVTRKSPSQGQKVPRVQYMLEDLEAVLPTTPIIDLPERLGYATLTTLRRAIAGAGRTDLLQRIDLKQLVEAVHADTWD